MENETLLKIDHLSVDFPLKDGSIFGKKQYLSAASDVSLEIKSGETLGLVGESGCGKSTLADSTLGFIEPTSGNVFFKGQNLYELKGKEYKKARQKMSKVFQDPLTSINPRFTVYEVLKEPLLFQGEAEEEKIRERAKELIEEVGLSETDLERHPREFSGGQQQRIAIARALMLRPEYLVLDEPTSSLDVSLHKQIISLLMHFKEKYRISYLLISHNLNLVKSIGDKVAVMYLGKIVEYGPKDSVFCHPLHPYTKALLSSVIDIRKKNQKPFVLEGNLPSPINPPSYCRFYSRCPMKKDCCKAKDVVLIEAEKDHFVACLNQSKSDEEDMNK